jgi:hypothetical protein
MLALPRRGKESARRSTPVVPDASSSQPVTLSFAGTEGVHAIVCFLFICVSMVLQVIKIPPFFKELFVFYLQQVSLKFISITTP